MGGSATVEELVAEGASVPLEGWDFSWFEGRATEEPANDWPSSTSAS